MKTANKKANRRQALCAASLIMALAMLMSCLSSCALTVKAAELTAGVEREKKENVQTDEKAFAEMMYDLAATLLKKSRENGSTVISPVSAAACLSMIAQGTGGETKKQLDGFFGCDTDEVKKGLYLFFEDTVSDKSGGFSSANSLWIRDSFAQDVKESYIRDVVDWSAAQIYSSDFSADTVKDINNWCADKTEGMIKEIIEGIDPLTVMYMINAVCFDAKWRDKYEDGDITDGVFHNADGSLSNVKMLCSTESRYIGWAGAKGFIRPYEGEKYAFVGILPDKSEDFEKYVSSLDGETWKNLLESDPGTGAWGGVYVKMPEFKIESDTDVKKLMEECGVSELFGPDCDFSRLSDRGDLYCSEIKQKAFIELDRNGTKAAAVTWGDANVESVEVPPQIRIILDRPFIFAVIDIESGIPLFMGTAEQF